LIYVPVGNAGRGDGVDVYSYAFATQALTSVGSISGSNTLLNGNDPLGLAVDESGNIYVSDTTASGNTGVIYEYPAGSGVSGISNVAPIRTITTTMGEIQNLWAAHGMVYGNVATTQGGTGSGETLVFGPSSNSVPFVTIAPTGTDAILFNVATDASGNIYVVNGGTNGNGTDTTYQGVYEYTSSGTPVTTIAESGGYSEPISLAFDSAGDLFVNNYYSHNSSPYACCGLNEYAAGTFASNPTPTQPLANGTAGAGSAIAIDTRGDLFVADGNVEVFAAGYTPSTSPVATAYVTYENTFNLGVYPHP
jgi:hypothetical protein